jgi:type IV pilus assembly protein PilA
MKTELKAKFIQYLNQRKNEHGFTLVELLVVIIVIGILAAVSSIKVQKQSKQKLNKLFLLSTVPKLLIEQRTIDLQPHSIYYLQEY